MVASMSNLILAQNYRQQNTDSVFQLIKKYFNEKNSERLYELTGEAFQKDLSPDDFKTVCDKNLFPRGEIKNNVLEKNSNEVSTYKVVFSSMNLSLLLSLDKKNKIETFLFKQYVEEKAKKNYAIPSTNKLTTPLDREVDSAVKPYITMQPTTGLSIGILRNGKTIFYGYGETAKGNKQVPDEHTIFEIGSISKTFTAILLADAVNSAKVKLDDPINKYLPDSIPLLEYQGVPVTLKTLSNHSSGIPGIPSNFHTSEDTNPYKDYDNKDLYSFYKTFRQSRRPCEKYEYSNLAAGTLGVIIEKVYRKDYEALFIEKICAPLGMNDTRQFIRKNDSARFAKGYNANGAYNSPWDFKTLAPAGAIRSTAADLLRYAKANLGDAIPWLLKDIQLTHTVTFTDGTNRIGLAWHYIKPGNDEILFHNGGTGGYRSYLAINLKKKFAVVILSNTSVGTEETGNAIMKWLESSL